MGAGGVTRAAKSVVGTALVMLAAAAHERATRVQGIDAGGSWLVRALAIQPHTAAALAFAAARQGWLLYSAVVFSLGAAQRLVGSEKKRKFRA